MRGMTTPRLCIYWLDDSPGSETRELPVNITDVVICEDDGVHVERGVA